MLSISARLKFSSVACWRSSLIDLSIIMAFSLSSFKCVLVWWAMLRAQLMSPVFGLVQPWFSMSSSRRVIDAACWNTWPSKSWIALPYEATSRSTWCTEFAYLR